MFRHESWAYIIGGAIALALLAVAVDIVRGHAGGGTIVVALGWGVAFVLVHALLNARRRR